MTSAELADLIKELGVPAVLTKAKPPGASTSISFVLTQSTSRASDPVVNQYGVNGREFVFHATDIANGLEKFDTVVISSEKYVLDAVIPLHEIKTGAVMGYRAFSKGK